jgi:uncharacterized protein YjiS (DUF1127 family)
MIATLPRTTSASPAGRIGARRGLVATAATYIAQLWRTRRDRRVLASLPDHMLSDIGLSRADIDRELLRPAWAPIDYAALEAARHRAARRLPGAHRPL